MYGELLDLIPIRYRADNPVNHHSFSVLSPRIWCYQEPVRACTRLVVNSEVVDIELSGPEESILFDAICGLASLGKNGRRDIKYLGLYKVVELLGGPRTQEQAAVRHYLAHSPKALTRPSTVQTLQNLFGGVSIDWNRPGHQRLFWKLFGELLVTADLTLSKLLTEEIASIRPTLSGR